MTQPPVPLDLIEGPARVFFAMEPDAFYTAAELKERAGISNSTCQRHVEILTQRGVIQRLASQSIRGRPAFFYTINKKEPQPL